MSEAGAGSADGAATRGRTRRGWVFAVVAVVVVVAGVLGGRALWSGTDRSADPAPTSGASTPGPRGAAPDCPSSHEGAGVVPAQPSGVDAAASLVPGHAPDAAVVCRYDVATNADFAPPTDGQTPAAPRTPPYPLTGSRALPADLQRLAADLSVVAAGANAGRPCTMMAGPSSLYLIGLTYGTGRLWVAAEQEVNRCTGATNGQFTSPVYLGDVVAEAYDAGAWTGWTAPTDSCVGPVVGRTGADREVVPGEPAALTLCEHAANPDQPVSSDQTQPVPPVRVLRGAEMEPVLSSLRALRTSVLDTAPVCPQGKPNPSYEVVASYPAGPAVRVTVSPGCTPAVVTDALQARSADEVVAAIKAATGW